LISGSGATAPACRGDRDLQGVGHLEADLANAPPDASLRQIRVKLRKPLDFGGVLLLCYGAQFGPVRDPSGREWRHRLKPLCLIETSVKRIERRGAMATRHLPTAYDCIRLISIATPQER
jgi:hypothetical protein